MRVLVVVGRGVVIDDMEDVLKCMRGDEVVNEFEIVEKLEEERVDGF